MVLHFDRFADKNFPLSHQVKPGEIVEINEIFYFTVGEKDHLRFMRCGTFNNFRPGRNMNPTIVDMFARKSVGNIKIYHREDKPK